MDQINTEILRQFEAKGLTINEGIAVDARLVKSASRPVSNEKLKELKKKTILPKVNPVRKVKALTEFRMIVPMNPIGESLK